MLAVYDNGRGSEPNLTNLRFTRSNANGSWPGIVVGMQTGGDGDVFSTNATIDQNDWSLVPVTTTAIYAFRTTATGMGVDGASYNVATNDWSDFSPAPPPLGAGRAAKSGAGLFGATDQKDIWLFVVSTDAANSAIQTAGLTVGRVSTASSATVPSGSVISQNPVAGTRVVAASAVALVVSSGQPQVATPNVVGLTQAAATTAITSATLTVVR
jgi:hypothetical protein